MNFNKLKFMKIIILLFILINVMLLIFFVKAKYCNVSKLKTVKSIEYKNINYDSNSSDINLKKVKEFFENKQSSLKTLNISFNMQVYSINDWNNIFQTTDINDGMRMELSKPNNIAILVRYKQDSNFILKGYPLLDNLKLNEWYKVNIVFDMDSNLKVMINNEKFLDVTDPNIDFDISKIIVGRGFNLERIFNGEIRNFTIHYKFFDLQKDFLYKKLIFKLYKISLAVMILIILFLCVVRLVYRTQTTLKMEFWLLLMLVMNLLTLHIFRFWNLPMGEDAGLYAYLSKAIIHGKYLHRDIYFSSNSIAIYITAFIFKLFGASLTVYRLMHVFWYYMVSLIVYVIVAREKDNITGFFAAIISGVVITVPHMSGDLGRNYLVLSTALLIFGFFLKSKESHYSEIYLAVCLGLAALTRETFLIFPIVYVVFNIIKLLYLKFKKKKDIKNEITKLFSFIITLGGVFFINIILLTIFDGWSEYFQDMLSSGTNFRYKDGIFAVARIKNNLAALSYGYHNFYLPLIFATLIYYLHQSKSILMRYIKFFIIPTLIVEILIINKTTEYTILSFLIIASIVTCYLFNYLLKELFVNKNLGNINFRNLLLIIISVQLVCVTPKYIKNINNELLTYTQISQKRDMKNSNEHTERILYIVNQIPHKSVTTLSQFPFLFLSPKVYCTNPFIEDLSAPANMNRPLLGERQIDYIKNKTPDLMILKTTDGWLSKQSDFGGIIDKYFILIADFDFSLGGIVCPYKDRIYISKSNFLKNYKLEKKEKIELKQNEFEYQSFNSLNRGVIIEIQALNIESFSVNANLSKIIYDKNITDNNSLFSFIPANTSFTINCAEEKTIILKYYEYR